MYTFLSALDAPRPAAARSRGIDGGKEEVLICPVCNRSTPGQTRICPACGTRVHHPANRSQGGGESLFPVPPPDTLNCKFCNESYKGIPYRKEAYLKTLMRSSVTPPEMQLDRLPQPETGFRCEHCGLELCADCRLQHLGSDRLSEWDGRTCPHCSRPFGPGKALLDPELSPALLASMSNLQFAYDAWESPTLARGIGHSKRVVIRARIQGAGRNGRILLLLTPEKVACFEFAAQIPAGRRTKATTLATLLLERDLSHEELKSCHVLLAAPLQQIRQVEARVAQDICVTIDSTGRKVKIGELIGADESGDSDDPTMALAELVHFFQTWAPGTLSLSD